MIVRATVAESSYLWLPSAISSMHHIVMKSTIVLCANSESSYLMCPESWDVLVNETSLFPQPPCHLTWDVGHLKFSVRHMQFICNSHMEPYGVRSKRQPRVAIYAGWEAIYEACSINYDDLVRYNDSARVSFFAKIAIITIIMTIGPIRWLY